MRFLVAVATTTSEVLFEQTTKYDPCRLHRKCTQPRQKTQMPENRAKTVQDLQRAWNDFICTQKTVSAKIRHTLHTLQHIRCSISTWTWAKRVTNNWMKGNIKTYRSNFMSCSTLLYCQKQSAKEIEYYDSKIVAQLLQTIFSASQNNTQQSKLVTEISSLLSLRFSCGAKRKIACSAHTDVPPCDSICSERKTTVKVTVEKYVLEMATSRNHIAVFFGVLLAREEPTESKLSPSPLWIWTWSSRMSHPTRCCKIPLPHKYTRSENTPAIGKKRVSWKRVFFSFPKERARSGDQPRKSASNAMSFCVGFKIRGTNSF